MSHWFTLHASQLSARMYDYGKKERHSIENVCNLDRRLSNGNIQFYYTEPVKL